ncbi:MAG: hypothetical protein AMS22_01635 [Thiotrichales bacterium SG8_50]|nr:MAG: hypothetical protein AMS22_01635 [Thiotrichales bacterium SG8_50]
MCRIRDIVGTVAGERCLALCLALGGVISAQAGEEVVYTPWDGDYGAYVVADEIAQVRIVAELVATQVDGQPAAILALALRQVPAPARQLELAVNGVPWLAVELDPAVSDFGVVLPGLSALRDIRIAVPLGGQSTLVRRLTIEDGVGASYPDLHAAKVDDSLQVRAGSPSQRWLTFRCGPGADGVPLESASIGADGEQARVVVVRVLTPAQFLIGDVGLAEPDAAGYHLSCEDTAGRSRSVKANSGK